MRLVFELFAHSELRIDKLSIKPPFQHLLLIFNFVALCILIDESFVSLPFCCPQFADES